MWVVWLVAGLGDWFMGWLVGCLLGRLFSGLVDWSVSSLSGPSFGRLIVD